MNRKSQISAEFFVLLGLAFLIAISFEIASLEQLNELRAQKESEAMNDLALKLQKELLIAAYVEDGYIREFEIPESVDNINYSLTTQASTISIESKNSFYLMPVPAAIGSLSKGANKINKTGGVIYIN